MRLTQQALATAPVLLATERLRIGAPTQLEGHHFGRVASVAIGDTGDIFVLDDAAAEVVVFDRAGRVKHRFGKRGQGPGEFSSGGSAAIAVSRDTVFVLERVLHAFDNSGRVLYTRISDSLRPGEPRRRINALVHTHKGLLVTRLHPAMSVRDGEQRTDTLVVQRRSSGGVFERHGQEFAGRTTHRRGDSYFTEIFGASPSLALAGTGHVYYSRGDEYRVDVFDANGHLVAAVIGEITSRASTRSEVAAAYERLEAGFRKAEAMTNTHWKGLVENVRRIPVAPTVPILARIVAGSGDTLVIERAQAADDTPEDARQSHWDVVSLKGGIIGRTTLPLRFQPTDYKGGSLYGIGTTPDGVAIVLRYDLSRVR